MAAKGHLSVLVGREMGRTGDHKDAQREEEKAHERNRAAMRRREEMETMALARDERQEGMSGTDVKIGAKGKRDMRERNG